MPALAVLLCILALSIIQLSQSKSLTNRSSLNRTSEVHFWSDHIAADNAVDNRSLNIFVGADDSSVRLTRPTFLDIEFNLFPHAFRSGHVAADVESFPHAYQFSPSQQLIMPSNTRRSVKFVVYLKKGSSPHIALEIGDKEVHVWGEMLASSSKYHKGQEPTILISESWRTLQSHREPDSDHLSSRMLLKKLTSAHRHFYTGHICKTAKSDAELWNQIQRTAVRFVNRKFSILHNNCLRYSLLLAKAVCGGERKSLRGLLHRSFLKSMRRLLLMIRKRPRLNTDPEPNPVSYKRHKFMTTSNR